jgi:hypothetical protein
MSVQYGGDKITFADGSTVGSGWTGFKNRIINGAMVVSQRNGTSVVTPSEGTNTFFTDRFKMYKDSGATLTGQQSTTAPNGFSNSLLISTTTGSSPTSGQEQLLIHVIEGYNFADLGWGTASPQNITLSFQVRSSLTGTFSGGIQASGTSATYVFNYTINAANTWETKTITIAGPTTGTFSTTNGVGLYLIFDIGSGSTYEATANTWTTGNKYRTSGSVRVAETTGATWYITGVQLEKGSTATSFDYRPYGTELQLCQRYCFVMSNTDSAANRYALGFSNSTTKAYVNTPHPVPMRTKPSLTSTGASSFQVSDTSAGVVLTAISIQSVTSDVNKTSFDCTTASGLTAYRPYYLEPYVGASAITLSAEL